MGVYRNFNYLKFMKLLTTLFLLIFLIACDDSNDVDQINQGFTAPIVTGYFVRNHLGEVTDIIGNPNTNTGYESFLLTVRDNETKIKIAANPNPSSNFFDLVISNIESFQNVSIRLVKAYLDETPSELQNMGTQGMFVNLNKGILLSEGVINQGSHQISFSSVDLEPGFYRLYVEGDGWTLWDNIVIEENNRR